MASGTAEKGSVAHFDVPAISEANADGLQIIHMAALYSPGNPDGLYDHARRAQGGTHFVRFMLMMRLCWLWQMAMC